MLKSCWIWLAAWLVWLDFSQAAASPTNSGVSGDFPFLIDVWQTGPGEEKLPQSSVISVMQSHEGYLWLGTLNGLVRFDGVRFTVFDIANTPDLACNRIICLFEDSRSNLWVGTETAGVVLIRHDGTVRRLVNGAGINQRLVSACEDITGAVWLNTADGQVVRYRDGHSEVLRVRAHMLAAETNGVIWLGVEVGNTDTKQVEHRLIGLAADSAPSAFVVRDDVLLPGRLDYLLASRRGGFWCLVDGRVQKWLGSKLMKDLGPYPWDPGRTPVRAACEDPDGNLIVGTLGGGVFWYTSAGGFTQISTAQGLSHNYVLSLCLDGEGNLWVGTDGGGLNRVKRRVFHVVGESRSWTVQSISEDPSGGLWLGTFGSGLRYLKSGIVKTVGIEEGLTNLYIRSVLADPAGRVLVGTAGSGLFTVTSEGFRPLPGTNFPNPSIAAIRRDARGRLWFGTQGGLVCADGREWRNFTTREGLSSDSVRAIAEQSNGSLLVGTEGGDLQRFQDGQFTSIPATNRAGAETITSLLVDAEGVVWIGTDGTGLQRWDGREWTTYSKRNGLVSDSIGYLVEDGNGYLWIGSYAGLMRVPLKALNDFAHHTADFIPCRAFGESDGLPSSECTQGSEPAACLSREGLLWIPTAGGLAFLNPAELKINTNQAPLIIESVLVEGREQNTNLFGPAPETVVVPPGKERLDIYYTSLNFSAPGNVRFRYRLEGHESSWTEAGFSRVARFTKLAPGRYQFHVTACNEDGIWNEAGAVLAVTVLPPFWRTTWFIGSSMVVLIGLFALIVGYLSTQKLQRQLAVMRQQEALEKERGRIARDLHDQLGANLTQVALLGEMAEADKDAPKEVESHAHQISQTARETTRALDEIVWAVNPSNDTIEGLITYACKYAQDYFGLAGLRYRLDVPTQLPEAPVAPDVRHNVFLAFKEAVHNVVKHARASEARIRLEMRDSQFVVEIQDNGCGFSDRDAKAGRNGLRNMRRRMEDIGGSFAMAPAEGGGTRVQLTVPVKH